MAYAIALVVNKFTLPLERMPCIYYLFRLRKNQAEIQALINFGSKVNAITPDYTSKLGFKV